MKSSIVGCWTLAHDPPIFWIWSSLLTTCRRRLFSMMHVMMNVMGMVAGLMYSSIYMFSVVIIKSCDCSNCIIHVFFKVWYVGARLTKEEERESCTSSKIWQHSDRQLGRSVTINLSSGVNDLHPHRCYSTILSRKLIWILEPEAKPILIIIT